MTYGDNYIKLTCIRSGPGNDKFTAFVRAGAIVNFAEAAPDYAKIGGAATVDLPNGNYYVVQESVEEILVLLSKVVVDP